MYTKYKIKYGKTEVNVVHFKPIEHYKTSSEYIAESKKLADNLQSNHKIDCSAGDYITVLTAQGYMKMLVGEYYVVMNDGKGFVYRPYDFQTTFEKV